VVGVRRCLRAPAFAFGRKIGRRRRNWCEVLTQDSEFPPDNETIVFPEGHGLLLADKLGRLPVKLADAQGHV